MLEIVSPYLDISFNIARRLLFSYLSSFFFQSCRAHLDLHSFPTRRSSDLPPLRRPFFPRIKKFLASFHGSPNHPIRQRSEEHTSELQSLTNLVCRLLLEKKKLSTIRHPVRSACRIHWMTMLLRAQRPAVAQ